jgi:hypothetical protein
VHPALSLAGFWQAAVALPVYQFCLLVWLWRWALWTRFLWHISRLDLQLIATHPDRAGGLDFVARPSVVFGLVPFVVGLVLSAAWCGLVLFDHARLAAFRSSIGAFVALTFVLTLGPLVVFGPKLYRVQQRELGRYGALIHEYMQYFDRTWVGAGAPHSDGSLAQLPAETMANLGAGYDVVTKTRLVPFDRWVAARLLVAALVPFVPLALTTVPLSELGTKLIKAFA